MVSELIETLSGFGTSIKPWITVLPYQQAVRIRFGKYERLLEKGMYLKIPIIDKSIIASTKREFVNVPIQDVMTSDGKILTVGATASFRIVNLQELLHSVSQPEDAITELASSFIAKYIRKKTAEEFDIAGLEQASTKGLARNIDGLGEIRISITTIVAARTYRLIMAHDRTEYGEGVSTKES